MQPLELQRLVARGAGSLPDIVVVDVGGLMRHHTDYRGTDDVLVQAAHAIERGRRHALYVCAPPCVPSSSNTDSLLSACAGLDPSARIVQSKQPLVGLAAHAGQRGFAIVTSHVEDHPHELQVLACGCEAVLDVATGKAWTPANVARVYCAPAWLPFFATVAGLEVNLPVIDKDAASLKNQGRLRHAIEQHPDLQCEALIAASDLSSRAKGGLQRAWDLVQQQCLMLMARTPVDDRALAHFRQAVGSPDHARIEVVTTPLRPFIVADVDTPLGGCNRFKRIAIVRGPSWRRDVIEAEGHDACVDLLRAVPTNTQWCAPRAIDLLGAMFDADVPLPSAIVDPGFDLFLLDPDEPPALGDIVPVAYSLDAVTVRWLSKPKHTSLPPKSLRPLALLLEEIDGTLTHKLAGEDLARIRSDFAYTLPFAVAATSRGFQRCSPAIGWDALIKAVNRFWQDKTNEAAPLLRLWQDKTNEAAPLLRLLPNSYQSSTYDLRGACDRLHSLPLDCIPKGFPPPSASQMFERHVVHFPEAKAVSELRSLIHKPGALGWFWRLFNVSHVRGRIRIQRTGRLGLARLPMQNVPKKGPFAMELRQTLGAPDGYVLVGADFAAFEARIIAHISQDPVLLCAARSSDNFHEHIALKLGCSGDEAKQGIYGLGFGQTLAGFVNSQVKMTVPHATVLYENMRRLLCVAFDYAEQVRKQYDSQQGVRTLGGWRRYPDKAGNAFSALVQGSGADILRHVLRELAIKLPAGAHVVHIVHDEIVVACPDAEDIVAQVRFTLKDFMEHAGQRSGLLPDAHLLLAVKGPKVGRTLAEIT